MDLNADQLTRARSRIVCEGIAKTNQNSAILDFWHVLTSKKETIERESGWQSADDPYLMGLAHGISIGIDVARDLALISVQKLDEGH